MRRVDKLNFSVVFYFGLYFLIQFTMSLEIDSKDIIKLMLQYMKENNLQASAQALQQETGITLNTVSNTEAFVSQIQHGKWELVLPVINEISLPKDKLVSYLLLYFALPLKQFEL